MNILFVPISKYRKLLYYENIRIVISEVIDY